LTQRIGERLARPASSKAWRWAIAAAGLFAVGLAVLLWPAPPKIETPVPSVAPPRVLELVEPPPTAWDYRQALNRSSEALEELLDRHSTPLASPEPIAAFPMFGFHAEPNPSSGDQ
jgi:hypothetical protein